MARPKKEEIAAEVVSNEKTKAEIENEQLKAQMAAMQEQLAKLMAMQMPSQPIEQKKQKRKITFVNMLPNEIVLRGTKFHTIHGQFESAVFGESEAQEIVANMYNAIKNGYLYIADAQFVEDNDLEAIYEDLLSAEQLKELFAHDSNYIIEAYKNAGAGQKQIIINMLADKQLKGETVDANVLMAVGKLCGKNLLDVKPFEEN